MQTSSSSGGLVIFLAAFIIIAASFLFGAMIAGEEYHLILLIGLGVAGIVLYFFAGKYFWVICFAAIFIPIPLPFLPLGMKFFEVMLIAALVHYGINEIVFRKNFPKVGILPDGLFLIFAVAVVLYHAIEQRFGVRLLGSDIWGGRAYLSILASSCAYFCLQSQRANLQVWNKIPVVVLIFATLNFLFQLAKNVDPGRFAFFSQSEELLMPEFSRWGFLGNFGLILILSAVALVPVQRLLSRGKLWLPIFFIGGYLLSLAAGYRSSFLNSTLVVLLASFRDLRFKSIFLIIPLVLLLASVSFINSTIYRLPEGVQRGLVWLPGDWDYAIERDASGSDEFRWQVWEYFFVHEFPRQMWIGRGLGVSYREILISLGDNVIDPSTGQIINTMDDRSRSFYVTGNLHNGFLSVLDRFGIIGGVFIFLFIASGFVRLFGYLLKNSPNSENFVLQWISLYGCMYCISFPIGALRVDDFLPVFIMLIGIFNHINQKKIEANTTDPGIFGTLHELASKNTLLSKH